MQKVVDCDHHLGSSQTYCNAEVHADVQEAKSIEKMLNLYCCHSSAAVQTRQTRKSQYEEHQSHNHDSDSMSWWRRRTSSWKMKHEIEQKVLGSQWVWWSQRPKLLGSVQRLPTFLSTSPAVGDWPVLQVHLPPWCTAGSHHCRRVWWAAEYNRPVWKEGSAKC